jgi:predicted DNA-binding transcriptional regulator AlpA
LGRRLGFKRDTVLAYLSRRNFRRIPRPNRLLAMGPIWYEKSVREWEAKERGRTPGR